MTVHTHSIYGIKSRLDSPQEVCKRGTNQERKTYSSRTGFGSELNRTTSRTTYSYISTRPSFGWDGPDDPMQPESTTDRGWGCDCV